MAIRHISELKEEKNNSMEEQKIDKKLDIKGVVCPYTLVKSKLAIEGMEVGQILEIVLDFPEASESIN
jgi:TusA-related sulfurtransferase